MKILIKNVNVFDGKHAELTKNARIVIEGNLVTEITTACAGEDGFDRVIDGGGRTAMPGLTDAHVHIGRVFTPDATNDYAVALWVPMCQRLLEHGITTVRDAGGICGGIKRAVDNGSIPGPRIYPSQAYLSQTCGHGDTVEAHALRDIQYRIDTGCYLVDGRDEVLRAVRECLYRGASQIKLMAGGGLSSEFDPLATQQFTEDEMRAAVEAASDYGTYVMAHLYTTGCIQRAVRAGIKSLEHAHVINDESARMIADNGVFVMNGPQFTMKEMEWNHMGKWTDYPASRLKPRRPKGGKSDMFSKIPETTENILKYDLKLIFGTDMMVNYPEYQPRANLDLTVFKQRFGSFRGLLAATGNIHDLLQLTTYQNPYPEGHIGILTQGSYADILLVDGNPVEDLDILGDVSNIRMVMKDGNIYKDTL